VLTVIGYIYYNGFSDWGGSSEAIIGNGFFVGTIGLFFIIGSVLLHRKYYSTPLNWLLLSFGLLSFFQPKWGEWIILPLLPLLSLYFSNNNDRIIHFLSKWFYFIIIVFTLLVAFPTINDISLIQEGISLQKEGHKVVNDWGLGHYIEYYGGIPSQKGSNKGGQDIAGGYWIGPLIPDCNLISRTESLFLQKC